MLREKVQEKLLQSIIMMQVQAEIVLVLLIHIQTKIGQQQIILMPHQTGGHSIVHIQQEEEVLPLQPPQVPVPPQAPPPQPLHQPV